MEKSENEVFWRLGKVAKNLYVQGCGGGTNGLGSKVSRGFEDNSLSCMEIGCAVPNGWRNGDGPRSLFQPQKKPGIGRAQE
jgi:hypothetical protein